MQAHLDDLQWCTPTDLSFILRLVSTEHDDDQPSNHPILLICVYRDNEVGPDHIVETMLLGTLPPETQIVKLEPLTITDVIAFVSEALRYPNSPSLGGYRRKEPREDPAIRTLSEIILARTAGSPLFVAQASLGPPSA